MVNILDGKLLASEMKDIFRTRVLALKAKEITPGLGTLLVGEDPGSLKYVAGKHKDCEEVGIASIQKTLPANSSEDEILQAVDDLNADPNCMSYIVQLPLPKGVNQNKVLERIAPEKDADGLHPFNLGSLVLNTDETLTRPVPCTPYGIIKLVQRFLGDDFLNGKHIVVLGRGVTVGRSISLLLTRKDINATVTLCHTGTKNIPELCRSADVIVAAVGKAHFLQKDWVKKGAILLDVGVSRGADGKIQGDIAPEARENAGWISPNPGGVGPMTRAMLLDNVIRIAEQQVGV